MADDLVFSGGPLATPAASTDEECQLDFEGYLPPATVPVDPIGNDWRGPAGPQGSQGPAGPPGTVLGAVFEITETEPGDYLLTTELTSCIILQVQSTAAISSGDLNYTLELWDGVPDVGTLIYQATGITSTTYTDRASFFADLTGGMLYARIDAIDAATYTAVGVSVTASAVINTELPVGTGTVTKVTAGTGLSGGPITTTGTLLADWQGGVVTDLGDGLTLTTGTLAATGSSTAPVIIGPMPGDETNGQITVADSSSYLVIATPDLATGASGSLYFLTGSSPDAATGEVAFSTGQSTTSSSGSMVFETGGGASTGDVTFQSGSADTSDSGTVSFITGPAAGNSGNIRFIPGNAGSVRGLVNIYATTQIIDPDNTANVPVTLDIAGITMGAGTFITLDAAPTLDVHAATKKYVDDNAGSGTVTKVTAGAGLSGGDITNAGTIDADWQAGVVTVLGSGLTLSTGTLAATGGGGTVTKISTGTGLTGGDITNAGTVSLDTRAAGTLMGNSGTAAAAPSDIAVGTGLTMSGGTISATAAAGIPFGVYPNYGSDTINTANTIAAAHFGNIMVAQQPGTITAVGAALSAIVNGGTYQAVFATLNSGLVVQSSVVSNTIVATGTNTANLAFTLNSGVAIVQGTTYAAMVGRIDSTGTYALPIYRTGNGVGRLPLFENITSSARLAATSVANGNTITSGAGSNASMIFIGGRF